MLTAMLKEHQLKQQAKKEEIEVKKQEAVTAANNLTSALVDHLNEGSVSCPVTDTLAGAPSNN